MKKTVAANASPASNTKPGCSIWPRMLATTITRSSRVSDGSEIASNSGASETSRPTVRNSRARSSLKYIKSARTDGGYSEDQDRACRGFPYGLFTPLAACDGFQHSRRHRKHILEATVRHDGDAFDDGTRIDRERVEETVNIQSPKGGLREAGSQRDFHRQEAARFRGSLAQRGQDEKVVADLCFEFSKLIPGQQTLRQLPVLEIGHGIGIAAHANHHSLALDWPICSAAAHPQDRCQMDQNAIVFLQTNLRINGFLPSMRAA